MRPRFFKLVSSRYDARYRVIGFGFFSCRGRCCRVPDCRAVSLGGQKKRGTGEIANITQAMMAVAKAGSAPMFFFILGSNAPIFCGGQSIFTRFFLFDVEKHFCIGFFARAILGAGSVSAALQLASHRATQRIDPTLSERQTHSWSRAINILCVDSGARRCKRHESGSPSTSALRASLPLKGLYQARPTVVCRLRASWVRQTCHDTRDRPERRRRV